MRKYITYGDKEYCHNTKAVPSLSTDI